jgi:hypothetical protein
VGAGDDVIRTAGGRANDVFKGGLGGRSATRWLGFNRLRGGPGRDRVRTGPTGPQARVYQAKRRPALRLRLVVRWRRITAIDIRAVLRCVHGGSQVDSLCTDRAAIEGEPSGGHYCQGRLGKLFFKRLREVGIATGSPPGTEDDACFAVGIGFTDIVKRPSARASDLTAEDFRAG